MSRYSKSDYINREMAADSIVIECDCVTLEQARQALKDCPSADVMPVRHGHWEQDGHHIRCSECGIYFCDTDREGDSFPKEYCPNCGARMDGEE